MAAIPLLVRGADRVAEEDYAAGCADLDRALLLQRGVSEVYVLRAVGRQRSGNLAGARGDHDEAAALDPEHPHIFWNRGLLCAGMGDFRQAEADFSRVIALKPGDAQSHGNRGVSRMCLGRYEEALADLDEALRLRPSPDVFRNRGILRIRLGRYEEARADLDEALAQAPEDASALTARAELHLWLGEEAAFRSDVEAAMALGPNGEAHFLRGQACALVEQWPEAVAEFGVAAELEPSKGDYALWAFACGGDVDILAPVAASEGWPAPVARYLQGDLPETALLALANEATGRVRGNRLADVHGYPGIIAYRRGERAEALRHLHAAREAGATGEATYEHPRLILERLGE
jgi:tetratricopeptide (TPR) repeat protein